LNYPGDLRKDGTIRVFAYQGRGSAGKGALLLSTGLSRKKGHGHGKKKFGEETVLPMEKKKPTLPFTQASKKRGRDTEGTSQRDGYVLLTQGSLDEGNLLDLLDERPSTRKSRPATEKKENKKMTERRERLFLEERALRRHLMMTGRRVVPDSKNEKHVGGERKEVAYTEKGVTQFLEQKKKPQKTESCGDLKKTSTTTPRGGLWGKEKDDHHVPAKRKKKSD